MTSMVKVYIPGEGRDQMDRQVQVELGGGTVGDVLTAVSERYPALGRRLWSREGEVHRLISVYLNDEDIRFLESLETLIQAGDEISIVPAISCE